ncbi:hypothetical protein ARMGADRAFT_1018320 [Armillaria gallica]|uniref:Peptidase C14 caspase domain-containing protein n=1 Tax=Armillaria gallica TaxID=47427 RepID=A0A2H3CT70_ARMGA|nr:hypothetical protein ARMGADRAFT_1018320 [Armillaria gallica]
MQDASSAMSSFSFPEQEPGSCMQMPEYRLSTLHDAPSPAISTSTEVRTTEAILPPQQQDLECRVKEHEKLERMFAIECGMRDGIDSTALRDLAKEKVRNAQGGSDDWRLHAVAVALDNLYHLRLELAHWNIGGMTTILPNPSDSRADDFKLSSIKRVTSRSWVLIVAINAYQQAPLYGCVEDARLMKTCLIEDVGVLESRIELLLANHDASPNSPCYPSRANIIDKLHSLRDNPEIQTGDNIIIYFSGHGSTYRCSDFFPMVVDGVDHLGTIDAFCPADGGQYVNNCRIPNISDRELNTIISLIRDAKGNNITFIADCCHSGGVTRKIPSPGTPRVIPAPHGMEGVSQLKDMLQAGEESLKKRAPGAPSLLAREWKADMTSHVLLAACEDHQFAMEVSRPDGRVNGAFTVALVHALQSGLNVGTNYAEFGRIIARTTQPIQTPTVVGHRKKNLLWYRSTP